jgi:RimJ/RimL family protein N-acetyltransferase
VTLVRPAPPEHFAWIETRAHVVISASFRAMEAVDAQGRILAMVGFDGWTPSSVMLHVALEHPAALRHILRPALGLVFDPAPAGCGLRLINATVLGNNARSLRLVRHLGFRETHRIRDGWDVGVDIVLFEMRRRDCRYVNQEAAWAA